MKTGSQPPECSEAQDEREFDEPELVMSLKEVKINPAPWFLDYDADEDVLLLASAKIDEELGRMTTARGLDDLPLELLEMIVEPLKFQAVAALEEVNLRLKAACRRYTIAYLVCDNDYDCHFAAYYSYITDPGDRDRFSTRYDGFLNGRHVQFFEFHAHVETPPYANKRPGWMPYKPLFTCDYFIFHGSRHAFDRYAFNKMLKVLKPTNVWMKVFPDSKHHHVAVAGSIYIDMVSRHKMDSLKQWKSPRLAFKIGSWRDDYSGLELCGEYLEEWKAGKREIETVWAELGGKDLQRLISDIEEFATERNLTQIGDLKRWRGQFERADGAVLYVYARVFAKLLPGPFHDVQAHVILQAPGASTAFLRDAANNYEKRCKHDFRLDALPPVF